MTGTDAAVAIGCTLLGIGAGALTGLVTGSINAAKFRGSMEATLTSMKEGFDEDIARLENVDRDQWDSIGQRKDEIGNVAQRVANLEGQLKHRRAASAGGD